MKYLKIISLATMIMAFTSCRKNPINPIVGTWQEQAPCKSGPSYCDNFSFTSNGRYSSSSPANDTGTYQLSNNNTSITFTGLLESGTYNYQIINGNELILEKFYAIYSTGTPPPALDVTLIKTK